MRANSSLAVVVLMTALAAYPAVAEPPVGGDLVRVVEEEVRVVERGIAEQGPWLPLAGGAMEGDIEVQDHAIWFGNGSLRSDGELVQLTFDGAALCAAGASTPGCASAGDIEAVRAGPGLKGGGESGAVLLETDFAFVQRLVTGVCAPGFAIRAISGTGAVTCEEDTDTDTDTLGGLACASGQVAKRGASGWACGDDEDTTYSAGEDLLLTGTTFHVDTTTIQRRVTGACATGSSVREVRADGSVGCETDDDSGGTVTSVASGAGLTGGPITSTGTLSIATGGVTSAMLLDSTIAAVDLSDLAVTTAKLADGAVTSAKILDGTIVATDVDATSIQRRVSSSCAAGSAMRTIAQDGTVTCEADDDTLGGLACADDQVAKRRSGGWACAADADSGGTVTSVGSGAGLTGGPVTGAGTLSVAAGGIVGSMLAADSVDASKTKDEPAAAAGAASATLRVGTANTTLATVNVTFPADGLALVHSQATWENNPSSTETGNFVNVSLLEGSALLEGWRWDAGDDDGRLDLGQSHVSLLSVTAGAHSYTLKARTSSGTADADQGRLVVVWVASGL